MEKWYSPQEERWNVGSHALGFCLSLLAISALVVKAIDHHSWKILLAFLIYGVGVATMFLASTLYHSATDPAKRARLKVFDHSAIYLTIAGSYTPITLLTMPSQWGIPVLVTVWLIAIAGITLKMFFIGKHSKLSTATYLLMGWVIVVAIKPLVESMETAGLIWLVAGGIAYSIGAVLYQIKRIPFNHAIFHLFVLLGNLCHFITIYCYCLSTQ
ncbi:MAG: hemolysin III family protein [Marinilabiliales bacterium]|nr:hemolysin III family protein [Marinilabiliales bacterium]